MSFQGMAPAQLQVRATTLLAQLAESIVQVWNAAVTLFSLVSWKI